MSKVKVHPKFLVVLPKDVRETLGITIGDIVEIKVEDGKGIIIPLQRSSKKAILETHGIIKWDEEIEKAIEEGYKKMSRE
jgi:AbrB family looped-hinge helix DNA binding protein